MLFRLVPLCPYMYRQQICQLTLVMPAAVFQVDFTNSFLINFITGIVCTYSGFTLNRPVGIRDLIKMLINYKLYIFDSTLIKFYSSIFP